MKKAREDKNCLNVLAEEEEFSMPRFEDNFWHSANAIWTRDDIYKMLNFTDHNQRNLAHACAIVGGAESLKELTWFEENYPENSIFCGFNPLFKRKDYLGLSAVHYAIIYNHLGILKYIFENMPCDWRVLVQNLTLLDLAEVNDATDCTNFLLSKVPKKFWDALTQNESQLTELTEILTKDFKYYEASGTVIEKATEVALQKCSGGTKGNAQKKRQHEEQQASQPTLQPTTVQPSSSLSSMQPSRQPKMQPLMQPSSGQPTVQPTVQQPSVQPTVSDSDSGAGGFVMAANASVDEQEFSALLGELAVDKQSSPIYQRKLMALKSAVGTTSDSAILIKLTITDEVSDRKITIGYMFGSVTVARHKIKSEIYLIHVNMKYRKNGYSKLLIALYEGEVKYRARRIGSVEALCYIEIRECLSNYTTFWESNGFSKPLYKSASVGITKSLIC